MTEAQSYDYANIKLALRERFDAFNQMDKSVIGSAKLVGPAVIEWGFSLYVKGYLDACELKHVDPRATPPRGG